MEPVENQLQQESTRNLCHIYKETLMCFVVTEITQDVPR